MREKGQEVAGYFFNPTSTLPGNQRRLDALRQYSEKAGLGSDLPG